MRLAVRWHASFVNRQRLNPLCLQENDSLAPIVAIPVQVKSRRANLRHETARSSSKRHGIIARNVGGSFSPNRPLQGLNHRCYSPAVLTIAVATAIAARSFEESAKLLGITAELKISPRHLQTLCQEVGGVGVDEQMQKTRAYKERPLMSALKVASPPVPLAAVMIDGGRIQTREPEQGPGVHEPAWRETKTAVLLRMQHQTSPVDPQPELPACFAHPLGTTNEPPQPPESETAAEKSDWRPVPLVRSGLATLNNSDTFGWMAAAAAEDRGFFTASAKAFVSDGLPYNWSIHRRHFPTFEPILDFVHASEHVHNAAKATGQDTELGHRWAELCWQGRVHDVLCQIDEEMSRIGPPPEPDDEPEHPWCMLDRERSYLKNSQQRMDYPRYRREGLPITSSPVESWVKQLNQRVKGSEKFWNDDANPEAMLNLRAAWLSDEEELVSSIRNRPGHPYARPRQQEQPSLAA